MDTNSNILSIEGLLPFLADKSLADNIHIYASLESTNKTAKEMAANGCAHGTAVIADGQTAGKGRFGREFYSPPGTGLYMSIVLRPRSMPTGIGEIPTVAAAVIVCDVIENVTGQKAQIKWVNDILLGGKKICGILTEAMTGIESGGIDWIVIGIGINIDTAHFPNELRDTAGSLFPGQNTGEVRCRIAAEIIGGLLLMDGLRETGDILARYKAKLVTLGQKITVTGAGGTFDAEALDIDEAGRLLVRKACGETAALSSGEITFRNS